MVAGAYGVGLVDDNGRLAGSHRGNELPERSRAVRQLAMLAHDAGDAMTLLDQLGLTASEGKIT
jgi:hypothetical protein